MITMCIQSMDSDGYLAVKLKSPRGAQKESKMVVAVHAGGHRGTQAAR